MGFNEMLSHMVQDIAEYYSEDSTMDWPYVSVVKG